MNFRRGDHIVIERINWDYGGVEYTHHGIYGGNGIIFEYGGDSVNSARVRIISWSEFVGDSTVFYAKHYDTCFDADTVIRRAESKLGEQMYV
jgi:hypothetical protein